ncbi:MAG: prohibitin family protein [Elusimicrobiota bacterium]
MLEDLGKNPFKTVTLIAAGLVVLFTALIINPIFVVGPGQVGVTFNNISGETASYSQGTHFRIPIVHTVNKFDVKTQRLDILAEGASKDLQLVKMETVLNYHLDYTMVDQIYVKVGRDYMQKVIEPAVNEAVKAAVSQYQVERIIVERESVKAIIESLLAKRLLTYNIILENVNLVDIDFADEFNKVVEQKQIEEQKIKTAQYQRMQAEENKKRVILDAEGEARKQQMLKETVSDKGIALQWIAKWDGHLPQYMMGKDTSILITPKTGN